MVKYRVDETKNHGVVPFLELVSGETGRVLRVGIYDILSALYLVDIKKPIITALNRGRKLEHVRLSDYTDRELTTFSTGFNIPIDELVELRQAEKEYRARRPTS